MKTPERAGPALMGIFGYVDDLMKAMNGLKDRGTRFEVYTPSIIKEVQEALGKGPSPIRYFTFFGGLFGLISGFALAVYTVLQWRFIVSGKPIIPWIPFVIIGFEFLILFGVLVSVAGLLLLCRLPQKNLPDYYNPRFSDDRFGLLVYYPQSDREWMVGLLKEAGAEEVHEIQR
jgi:hypothetical protein